jgi:hypothetical protein
MTSFVDIRWRLLLGGIIPPTLPVDGVAFGPNIDDMLLSDPAKIPAPPDNEFLKSWILAAA